MEQFEILKIISINLEIYWHKPKLAREIIFYASQAYLGTMHFRKLHRVKQTKIISLANFVSVPFRRPFKILKVFANPIMRSMCTLLLEIFLSRNTVFYFLKNVWLLIVTSLEANKSCTLKFWHHRIARLTQI